MRKHVTQQNGMKPKTTETSLVKNTSLTMKTKELKRNINCQVSNPLTPLPPLDRCTTPKWPPLSATTKWWNAHLKPPSLLAPVDQSFSAHHVRSHCRPPGLFGRKACFRKGGLESYVILPNLLRSRSDARNLPPHAFLEYDISASALLFGGVIQHLSPIAQTRCQSFG